MIRMSSGLRASEKNLDRGLLPYRAIMDRRLKKADRFGFELPRSALCEKPMISKKSQFYVRRSGISKSTIRPFTASTHFSYSGKSSAHSFNRCFSNVALKTTIEPTGHTDAFN